MNKFLSILIVSILSLFSTPVDPPQCTGCYAQIDMDGSGQFTCGGQALYNDPEIVLTITQCWNTHGVCGPLGQSSCTQVDNCSQTVIIDVDNQSNHSIWRWDGSGWVEVPSCTGETLILTNAPNCSIFSEVLFRYYIFDAQGNPITEAKMCMHCTECAMDSQ